MGARGRRKERRARARTTGRRGEGAGGAQAGARDLSFAGRLPHPGGKSRRRTDAAASRGPAPERSAPGRGSGGGEGRETGPRGRGTAPPNDPRGSLSLSPHAPGGRAAAADAPAPRAGRRGPASHPTGGAANDPGDAAFPPLSRPDTRPAHADASPRRGRAGEDGSGSGGARGEGAARRAARPRDDGGQGGRGPRGPAGRGRTPDAAHV